ncbi:trna ligase, partial [Dispira parvispora]
MYKKVPCPFPILARGLFTRPSEDGAGYDIVARGYDKFFNLGEVAQTHPDWLKDHTSGPYELTVKENGCIILVGALNESQLLVTSKHSTGAIENADVSHSQVGDQWVDRHLATRQLTRADLASFLYQHQVTAVLELCDDEFEEHILEYTGDRRGLYLHGVNHNSATLHTWPSSLVTQVADHFGFHRTPYYTKSTYQEAAAFADQFHKEGTLEGRAVEGFVLRCLNKDTGKHFMYKIKYDMPYLLYREWREVTKRIIANKPIRIQHPLTHKYVRWVRGYLADHPDLAKQYVQNKRIIAVRDAFLAHMKQEGEDPEAMLQESAS